MHFYAVSVTVQRSEIAWYSRHGGGSAHASPSPPPPSYLRLWSWKRAHDPRPHIYSAATYLSGTATREAAVIFFSCRIEELKYIDTKQVSGASEQPPHVWKLGWRCCASVTAVCLKRGHTRQRLQRTHHLSSHHISCINNASSTARLVVSCFFLLIFVISNNAGFTVTYIFA